MTDRGGTRTGPSGWTGEYQGEALEHGEGQKIHSRTLPVCERDGEGGNGEWGEGNKREGRRERGERRGKGREKTEGGRGKGREREREREREWTHILALHGASLEDGVARALRAAEGGIISDGLATDEAG